MEIISTLMQYVVSVLYFVILVSKFNFFHKILLIISIYFVSKFNENLNNYLQLLIKAELPTKNLVEQKKKDGEKNIYGMPSGHAQSVIFSTIYTYFVTKSNNILIGSGFISMLSLVQRYRFKRHSIKQLIVGSLIGAGVALFGYNISTFYLTCK